MTARLTIDLAALTANYRKLAAIAPCGAVVKANAYGLGAQHVVRALEEAGCRDFFVATANEAFELSLDANLYVFEGVLSDAVACEMTARGVRPVINDALQLDRWRRLGSGPAAVHVDTGMQRLGFAPDALTQADLKGMDVALLMTHYACADTPDHPLNALQRARFATVAERLPGLTASLANSAGVLNGADWVGDLGRPGIALYGGNAHASAPNPMHPVATLEGQVVRIRDLPAATPIGYGATFLTERPSRIATLGIGYADGVPRLLSNRGCVVIGGTRCPIVGRVTMDALHVDVTGCEVHEGAWAEVMGEGISVDEVAEHAQTIPYEVLTGLGQRPERRYIA